MNTKPNKLKCDHFGALGACDETAECAITVRNLVTFRYCMVHSGFVLAEMTVKKVPFTFTPLEVSMNSEANKRVG